MVTVLLIVSGVSLLISAAAIAYLQSDNERLRVELDETRVADSERPTTVRSR
jgi:hypothetical protein